MKAKTITYNTGKYDLFLCCYINLPLFFLFLTPLTHRNETKPSLAEVINISNSVTLVLINIEEKFENWRITFEDEKLNERGKKMCICISDLRLKLLQAEMNFLYFNGFPIL